MSPIVYRQIVQQQDKANYKSNLDKRFCAIKLHEQHVRGTRHLAADAYEAASLTTFPPVMKLNIDVLEPLADWQSLVL